MPFCQYSSFETISKHLGLTVIWFIYILVYSLTMPPILIYPISHLHFQSLCFASSFQTNLFVEVDNTSHNYMILTAFCQIHTHDWWLLFIWNSIAITLHFKLPAQILCSESIIASLSFKWNMLWEDVTLCHLCIRVGVPN